MPAEDRDRLFENALARHLRSDAGASDAACPDPDLLAAYHERMLSPEEMNVGKEHLVSCARCQEILAQLEATENVEALRKSEADLVVSAVGSRSNVMEIVEESASVPVAIPAAQKPLEKIAPFPARKNSLLRWAAPAGAIAAGLLLWIGVREFRTHPKLPGESTQIAENRAQSSHNLDAAPAAPRPNEKEEAERSRDEEAYPRQPDGLPVAKPSDRLKTSRSTANLDDRERQDKKTPSPPIPASGVSKAPAQAAAHGTGAGSAGAVAGTVGGHPAAKTDQLQASSETVEVEPDQSQLVAQQNEIKQQDSGAAQLASPPPPAAPSKARRSAAVLAEAAAPAIETKDANQPAALSKALYNPSVLASEVMAPNGKSVWRFGAGGGIAYSSDRGKTWQPQSSGVTATLTYGSSPSEKVCWIAGTSATLLFTKDGGKHWLVITTPIAGDLGGVRATDAKHASIWDLPDRVSYETSDGGATWKRSSGK